MAWQPCHVRTTRLNEIMCGGSNKANKWFTKGQFIIARILGRSMSETSDVRLIQWKMYDDVRLIKRSLIFLLTLKKCKTQVDGIADVERVVVNTCWMYRNVGERTTGESKLTFKLRSKYNISRSNNASYSIYIGLY